MHIPDTVHFPELWSVLVIFSINTKPHRSQSINLILIYHKSQQTFLPLAFDDCANITVYVMQLFVEFLEISYIHIGSE